jgi:hypothetical protein
MSELLKEWQDRLFLQAWRIELRNKCKPDDMQPNCWGSTEWNEVNKTARIDIVDPECLTDKMIPFDFEKVLVHELLYLKLCLLSNETDSMSDRYVHQLIDEMARAFVDAKRCRADGEGENNGNV